MPSNFTIIEARRDGLPALIVVDLGLDPAAEAAAFPYLVTIVLPIAAPLPNGLPTPEENERLNDLEDTLVDRIKIPDWRYVGRITWNGTRSVLLYVKDPEAILEQLRSNLPPDVAKLEVHVSQEPDWATLQELSPKQV